MLQHLATEMVVLAKTTRGAKSFWLVRIAQKPKRSCNILMMKIDFLTTVKPPLVSKWLRMHTTPHLDKESQMNYDWFWSTCWCVSFRSPRISSEKNTSSKRAILVLHPIISFSKTVFCHRFVLWKLQSTWMNLTVCFCGRVSSAMCCMIGLASLEIIASFHALTSNFDPVRLSAKLWWPWPRSTQWTPHSHHTTSTSPHHTTSTSPHRTPCRHPPSPSNPDPLPTNYQAV